MPVGGWSAVSPPTTAARPSRSVRPATAAAAETADAPSRAERSSGQAASTLNSSQLRLSASLFDDDDEVLRETFGSEQSDEEEGLEYHPEYLALQRRKGTNPFAAATKDDLAKLVDWGLSYEAKPDSRLKALIGFLDGICRPGGEWSNERVVVFTEYADTVEWIVNVLTARGYGPRLAVIQGSTDTDERELIRLRFAADPHDEPVRVLVATDAAGEGIDLQAHCHRLVNSDVPWNPSRLEQRIGRIDRYGQTENPRCSTSFPSVTPPRTPPISTSSRGSRRRSARSRPIWARSTR